jgi:hypothetical protein
MSFKRLDQEDISISAESVVAPAWSGQLTTLSSVNFVTSSGPVGIGAGNYYYSIYQADPTSTGAAVQFSIAYGNLYGSGSTPIYAPVSGASPSSVVYGQYRTLINGDENTDFTFGNTTPNSVFVISVNRARYKEKLLPGSFNLTLSGSGGALTLTDNSQVLTTISYVDAGRVFDIVSGSNGVPFTGVTTTGFSPGSGSYGKFLPDVGTIILNAAALSGSAIPAGGMALPVNENSNILPTVNLNTFYNAIKLGGNFTLQSEETITSNYVFVRVRNNEFNYSTNPSIISSSGELRYDVLINTPQAYMTTVGLYNDNNDLLGVAKLSKPLLKDFTKEALVRIKLDY